MWNVSNTRTLEQICSVSEITVVLIFVPQVCIAKVVDEWKILNQP